jgi:hypothetical protein
VHLLLLLFLYLFLVLFLVLLSKSPILSVGSPSLPKDLAGARHFPSVRLASRPARPHVSDPFLLHRLIGNRTQSVPMHYYSMRRECLAVAKRVALHIRRYD